MADRYDYGMALNRGLLSAIDSYSRRSEKNEDREREQGLLKQKQKREDMDRLRDKGDKALYGDDGSFTGYEHDNSWDEQQLAQKQKMGLLSPEQLEQQIQIAKGRSEATQTPIRKEKEKLDLDKARKEAADASKGRPLPAGEASGLGTADYADAAVGESLNAIQSNTDQVGPVKGRFKGLLSTIGLNDKGAGLDSQLDVSAQTVGKFLEGGKMTDADIPRYRKMLPNKTDTPEAARLKTENVRKMIQQKKAAEAAALKGAGYNIGDLGDVKPDKSHPKAGDIVDGYKFLGGNPADPKSWSK